MPAARTGSVRATAKCALAVPASLALWAMATPAAAQEVTIGAYACQADRAVSIREQESGDPVSGGESPVAPDFRLLIAEADPADNFTNCLGAASADSNAIIDFCQETDAPFYTATLTDRPEPSFATLFAGDQRIGSGGRTIFRNGPSMLDFRPGRGDFRYTLFYSEPQVFSDGLAFDFVTEQGHCRKAD